MILRDDGGAELFSADIAAGDPDPRITIDVDLTAGETYTLVAEGGNNSRFAVNYDTFPTSNSNISVLASWGSEKYYPRREEDYLTVWYSFNDIETACINR